MTVQLTIEIMEIIKPIQIIYSMFDRMKNNNEQCPHVLQRLKALEKLVLFISQKEPDQLSDDVNEALGKLNKILLSAAELIGKFTEEFKLIQMVKSTDYKLEFEKLNKSLTDAFVTLAASLHVHQGRKLDKQEVRLAEQENMLAEPENMLHEQKKKLAELERKLAEQEDKLRRVESKLESGSRAYYCILQ